MAIRTAVALSDRRSPQRRAVTRACPAYFIGSEIHGSPGTVKVGGRRMGPAGFRCAASRQKQHKGTACCSFRCLETRRAFFNSPMLHLKGDPGEGSVGGQQTGSVRPVI